ncbi:MAG: hypothetical protein M1469_11330 [Bacteroidetes bacterium]|nr:hypothetical protein [Bacteroidota bacterium]
MLLKRQKAVAKSLLLVYLVIISTFELAHKDFVPLGGRLRISSLDSITHNLDTEDGQFVCPAHYFAQSTHGPTATSQLYIPSTNVTFIRIERNTEPPFISLQDFSARAPPQA